MQIENIELRKFADNKTLKNAVERFFITAVNEKFREAKLNHRHYTNEKLGEITRSVSQAEEIISQIFYEVNKYKSVESKNNETTNPAR